MYKESAKALLKKMGYAIFALVFIVFAVLVIKSYAKKLASGSYGWGDGDWMQIWEDDCRAIGANLVCDSVICNGEPDSQAIAKCKSLGAAL